MLAKLQGVMVWGLLVNGQENQVKQWIEVWLQKLDLKEVMLEVRLS